VSGGTATFSIASGETDSLALSAVLPAPMLNLARTLIVIGLAATLFAVARRYAV
jgi:hypothetical protein